MIMVVDASVLVAEALRDRGQALLARDQVDFLIADFQWSEARHELDRRIEIIVRRGSVSEVQTDSMHQRIVSLIDRKRIEVVPVGVFEHNREVALRRIPRDPNDWAPVALALTFNAGILTDDHDFLGCGCPTWTVETLLAELDA